MPDKTPEQAIRDDERQRIVGWLRSDEAMWCVTDARMVGRLPSIALADALDPLDHAEQEAPDA